MGGTAQPGQTGLIWTVGGEGSYAPYAWAPNDRVGFFDSELGFHGTTAFVSLSHVSAGLRINLAGQTPAGATQIGDLARVSARFLIRNNTFSYNRARGVLLESAFGIIEANDFVGQTSQGMVVGANSGSEGPGVQDVVVRGNRFSNIGGYRAQPQSPTPVSGNGADLAPAGPRRRDLRRQHLR